MPIILYTEADLVEIKAAAVREAVEDLVRSIGVIKPDLSAMADEHKIGARAGHERCMSMVLAEMNDRL